MAHVLLCIECRYVYLKEEENGKGNIDIGFRRRCQVDGNKSLVSNLPAMQQQFLKQGIVQKACFNSSEVR